MKKPFNTMYLNALELPVHLGWTTAERQKKQFVWLDLSISFPTKLKACNTDRLDDTVCYKTLIEHLHKKLAGKKFALIERLSDEIYHILKPCLPKNVKLQLRLTKYPQIKGLSGGVCFHFGDA